MNITSERFSAFIAYLLPVIGWVYVYFFQRTSAFAVFHLRQSIGLFLFLIYVFAAWSVAAWVLAWIPFMFIISMALFALVISALVVVIVLWLVGMVNALSGQMATLPFAGDMVKRLPMI